MSRYAIPPEHGKRLERLAKGKLRLLDLLKMRCLRMHELTLGYLDGIWCWIGKQFRSVQLVYVVAKLFQFPWVFIHFPYRPPACQFHNNQQSDQEHWETLQYIIENELFQMSVFCKGCKNATWSTRVPRAGEIRTCHLVSYPEIKYISKEIPLGFWNGKSKELWKLTWEGSTRGRTTHLLSSPTILHEASKKEKKLEKQEVGSTCMLHFFRGFGSPGKCSAGLSTPPWGRIWPR